jgi:hypothetical protein
LHKFLHIPGPARLEDSAAIRRFLMRIVTAALFLAMFLLCSDLDNGTVHAYLDPGTGAVALQLLLGGIVAALAAVRMYWGRLKALFLRRPLEAEPSSRNAE